MCICCYVQESVATLRGPEETCKLQVVPARISDGDWIWSSPRADELLTAKPPLQPWEACFGFVSGSWSLLWSGKLALEQSIAIQSSSSTQHSHPISILWRVCETGQIPLASCCRRRLGTLIISGKIHSEAIHLASRPTSLHFSLPISHILPDPQGLSSSGSTILLLSAGSVFTDQSSCPQEGEQLLPHCLPGNVQFANRENSGSVLERYLRSY